MSGLFKSPKMPTTTAAPAPAPPAMDAPNVQEAATNEQRRAAKAQGRNSTLLVTGTSDTTLPNRGKTLLGE